MGNCFGDVRDIDHEHEFCSSFTRAHHWDNETKMRVKKWLDESRQFNDQLSDPFNQNEEQAQPITILTSEFKDLPAALTG